MGGGRGVGSATLSGIEELEYEGEEELMLAHFFELGLSVPPERLQTCLPSLPNCNATERQTVSIRPLSHVYSYPSAPYS